MLILLVQCPGIREICLSLNTSHTLYGFIHNPQNWKTRVTAIVWPLSSQVVVSKLVTQRQRLFSKAKPMHHIHVLQLLQTPLVSRTVSSTNPGALVNDNLGLGTAVRPFQTPSYLDNAKNMEGQEGHHRLCGRWAKRISAALPALSPEASYSASPCLGLPIRNMGVRVGPSLSGNVWFSWVNV